MFTRRLLQIPRASFAPMARRAYATKTNLTPQQIEIVKATIPALEQHGVAITTLFYKHLLANHPELKNIFSLSHQATGMQPAALAHAVWAYASNIENPAALSAAISRIGHKHVSLGVTEDQYPIVGQGLLGAIKEVLGDAANEQVIDAWGAAYGKLAEYFIEFEKGLYKEAEEKAGGWKGWRKFYISKKVQESDEIISFHLTPVDKSALPTYKPGQFVSVKCFVPELGVYQPRQYSLSDAPRGDHFRISVKKEFATQDKPAGQISNVLHESLPEGAEVDISMPFGDFVLDLNATTPVVLISGGVGLTPMMSMLTTIAENAQSRRVVFVHAVRNSRVHAMKDTLSHIISENPQVSKAVFYEEVAEGDKEGADYDFEGRIELDKIRDMAILEEADYYICGPLPFMKLQSKSLEEMGVSPERIHMELFGAPSE